MIGRGRAGTARDAAPDRAVIDIGSNTVRMVVYTGAPRVPEVWLNERVTAKLGRDLAATGLLPDKAMESALLALARYAAIVEDLGIKAVETVATAAVRDAANGGEFLARVRALGLSPRLLSGEEEAFGAAYGVIGAFPGAQGTVADLGGGWAEYSLALDPGVDAGDVLQRCTASGLPLRRFEERRATLHDVFVHLVGSDESLGENVR